MASINGNGKIAKVCTMIMIALISALGTAFAYHIGLIDRVSRNEATIGEVRLDQAEFQTQINTRVSNIMVGVSQVVEHENKIADMVEKVIEQNTVLIAELKAARRNP